MAMSLASLLVVDDDDALVRMLTEAAETRGYQVGCATSMAAADAALNRDHFDVALVDLKLGAESGLDVIRHIKEQTPDAEIVVMSASTSLASAIPGSCRRVTRSPTASRGLWSSTMYWRVRCSAWSARWACWGVRSD